MKFTNAPSEYTQDLDVLESYITNIGVGVKRLTGLDGDELTKAIMDQPEMSKVRDLEIKILVKNDKGDRKEVTVPVVDYIKKIADSDAVFSPTWTTFHPKSKRCPPQSSYIKKRMKERKSVKGRAQDADLAGDRIQAIILTGVQNALKILINSFSGACLSAFNPFYSPALHQVLCAMCRVSVAIATALIERLLAGIRYYHTPEHVADDLLLTIQHCKKATVADAVETIGLDYATYDQCLEIIRRSYCDYWWDEKQEIKFTGILKSMDKYELSQFAYTNDLYNLLSLNPVSMKKLLGDLAFNDYKSLDTNVPWVMDSLSSDETNLIAGLIGSDIKGSKIYKHLKEGAELRPHINALAHRLRGKLVDYSVLADAFFRTKILPIDVGKQDTAIRQSVGLGDTDSSLYTTMLINMLYYGEISFEEKHNPITEVCIFFANGLIEHGLSTFTGQMNVDLSDRNELALKNEFRFTSLQMTPFKKTYFASVAANEGAVYADNKPHYEVKGQRFHAGKSNKEMVDELQAWMKALPLGLREGGKVKRQELIDMIVKVEEDILTSLDSKENVKFKTLRIKPFESYTAPRSQEWAKHCLWNWCFGERYGMADDKGYLSYKVPLKYDGGLEYFIKNAPKHVREGYEKYLDYVTEGDPKKRASKSIIYIPIPVDVMAKHGIPVEIRECVNLDKTIREATDPHLLMLANMDLSVFRKDNNRGEIRQKRISDILTD